MDLVGLKNDLLMALHHKCISSADWCSPTLNNIWVKGLNLLGFVRSLNVPDKYSGQKLDILQNNCTITPISNILVGSCNLAVTQKGKKNTSGNHRLP